MSHDSTSGDASAAGPLKHVNTLLRYQIQLLEKENRVLEKRVRSLEKQIRHLRGQLQLESTKLHLIDMERNEAEKQIQEIRLKMEGRIRVLESEIEGLWSALEPVESPSSDDEGVSGLAFAVQ
jgi:chromosome segregation ATPase